MLLKNYTIVINFLYTAEYTYYKALLSVVCDVEIMLVLLEVFFCVAIVYFSTRKIEFFK